jgi:hypothetical protein
MKKKVASILPALETILHPLGGLRKQEDWVFRPNLTILTGIAYYDIGFAFSNKAGVSNILYSCKARAFFPIFPGFPIVSLLLAY